MTSPLTNHLTDDHEKTIHTIEEGVEQLADLFKKFNNEESNQNNVDLGKKLLEDISKQLAAISKPTLSPVVTNTMPDPQQQEEEVARLRRELATSRQEKELAESQGRSGKIFLIT